MLIEEIVTQIYHEEEECMMVDVFGHFEHCHTHILEVFQHYFSQTVLVDHGFHQHLVTVT